MTIFLLGLEEIFNQFLEEVKKPIDFIKCKKIVLIKDLD